MSLLTILVPTFNRVQNLSLLLDTIQAETAGFEDRVDVIVGDNCSTDGTEGVLAAFKASWPSATIVRHERNLGPDENFCQCIDRVTSRYFWIIGDDDLPRAGVIRLMVELLANQTPDLVYLESDWRPVLSSNEPNDPIMTLKPVSLDRLAFARRVHVWSTFISGMIVNREAFLAAHEAEAWRRYSGTNLVQLGWVLGSIKTGQRFLHLTQKCVLATQGNTGGYKVLTVFGNNFPSIVADALQPGSALARAIIRRCALAFLPDLLWGLRFGHVGAFDCENLTSALQPQLGDSLAYRFLLAPIGHAPRPLARLALAASHAGTRLLRMHDRILERLTRSARPA